MILSAVILKDNNAQKKNSIASPLNFNPIFVAETLAG